MPKPKIYFVVDDDTDDQQFLIEALTENDQYARCVTAANGQEAINYLKNTTILPDAIFLDMNMPGLNGRQCLAELKRTPTLQHIPVIMYSTSSDKKEMKDTIDMGASYFLTKCSSYRALRAELLSMAILGDTPSLSL